MLNQVRSGFVNLNFAKMSFVVESYLHLLKCNNLKLAIFTKLSFVLHS